MPSDLWDIAGTSSVFFKVKLDEWLMREVPDEPKLGVYAGRTSELSNTNRSVLRAIVGKSTVG